MRGRRGSLLVLVVLALTFFISWLSIGLRRSSAELVAAETSSHTYRAIHLAEAGLDQVIGNLHTIDGTDDIFGGTLSGGTFTVQQPLTVLSPLLYQAHIEGDFANARRTIEAVLYVTPLSLFRFAAFGDQGVVLDGNNYIDSYDSRNGPYDLLTNANDEGDVGTNAAAAGAITLDGNSLFVNGQLSVGPGVADPATVVTGFDDSQIAGEPPVVSRPEYPMPTVQIPEGITCNPLTLNGSVTYTLPSPGTYCFSRLKVESGATLTSTGPVTVYLTESLAFAGNSTVGVVNNPSQFLVLMESGTLVTIEGAVEGNAEFYGAMYGPDAAFNIAGNADIYGSIIGNEIHVAGSARLHYDEALEDVDILSNEGLVALRSWQELN